MAASEPSTIWVMNRWAAVISWSDRRRSSRSAARLRAITAMVMEKTSTVRSRS
mgnify:CR=1 FL=1|jgi:hypothetical protein